jgi:hypothetical protein
MGKKQIKKVARSFNFPGVCAYAFKSVSKILPKRRGSAYGLLRLGQIDFLIIRMMLER